MASIEEQDQNKYAGGKEEEEDDLEEEESEEEEEEDEEDTNFASPSSSSTSGDLNNNNENKDSSSLAGEISTITATTVTGAATASAPIGNIIEILPVKNEFTPVQNRQQIVVVPVASEEKKPSGLDDSRRLFQRLWTDEDEIGLLQGFHEYTMQRGSKNSSHQYDAFYDQIKTRLQLDFNKNQLVEKLRRLRKKYRNVISRINCGKDFSFKSAHDQMTFEISRKIWSGITGGGIEEAGLEDEEGNLLTVNHTNIEVKNVNNNNHGIDANDSEKKLPSSRKRSRKRPAEDDQPNYQASPSIPNVIEDTVKSCLSPLFKELLNCATNGPCNMGGFGGMAFNPLPLNFGINSMNSSSGAMMDAKWKKQQILELEVYSKRLELVQDQIKAALEELRSTGSG